MALNSRHLLGAVLAASVILLAYGAPPLAVITGATGAAIWKLVAAR